ncbi:MAG: hypothetical protein IID41_14855 [Planctomycetes bacterium]|nr:hypothetical protein [Planctomycetota bacterium]
MVQAATADVVIRSRQKGAKVYKNVQAQLDRLNSRVKQFGLLAGAAAVGGLAILTAKSFASADALAKQADRLGTTTQALKTMQTLAVLTGGSSENMSKSLLKAAKALGEFNITGSGTAAPFLRAFNLDTQALARLRPDELFQVYAEKIRELGTRSEQTAAAAALFGDRTGEMLNLIDAGPEAFKAIEEEVVKYGIALDRVDSAKIEAANDAMFKVKERMTGVGNVIASKVAPIITAIANRFLDTGASADVMGNIVDKVMDGIAVGAGIIADAIFGWKIIFAATKIAVLVFATALIASFASIERAIAIVRNKMSEAFGGELVDVRGGFLTRVEDSLKASTKHAAELLSELIASEKPSLAIADALAKVREEAQLAAEAVAKQREQLQQIEVGAGTDINEIDQRAEERAQAQEDKLRERLGTKAELIATSLLNEEEREIQAFERRREMLELALEGDAITKQRFLEIELSLRERHENALTKITTKGLSEREKFEKLSFVQKAKTVFAFVNAQTAGVANSNKVMFRLNQAAALGNAVVNIAQGITEAWKFGPILGPPLAAIVYAAGAAQIAAIASASPGGGTTPSAAGSTPTFQGQPVSPFQPSTGTSGDAAAAPGTVINIYVEGSLIGDEGIRQILGETLGELVDADEIFISPESAQAAVIRQGTGSGG